MSVILEFQLQPDGTIHDLLIPETEQEQLNTAHACHILRNLGSNSSCSARS